MNKKITRYYRTKSQNSQKNDKRGTTNDEQDSVPNGNTNGGHVWTKPVIKSKPRGRPRKSPLGGVPNHSTQTEEVCLLPVRQRQSKRYTWVGNEHQDCTHNNLESHTQSKAKSVLKIRGHQANVKQRSRHCPECISEQGAFAKSVLYNLDSNTSQSVIKSSQIKSSVSGSNQRSETIKSLLRPDVSISLKTKPSTTKVETADSNLAIQTQQKKEPCAWPGDLLQLLETWEQLPEFQIVHWLQAPISCDSATLPPILATWNHMFIDWDETEGNKIEQITRWLTEDEVEVQPVDSPKVVVETQPTSQIYGRWSSMDPSIN